MSWNYRVALRELIEEWESEAKSMCEESEDASLERFGTVMSPGRSRRESVPAREDRDE